MRILIISNLYPPHYRGGYELRCRETADGLRELGHHVAVLTSTHGSGSESVEADTYRLLRYIPDETGAEAYSRKRSNGIEYAAAQLRTRAISRHNWRVTAEVAESEHPDVVYFWNMSCLTVSPVAAIARLGIPRVYCLGDRWLIDALRYFSKGGLLRRMARRALMAVGDPREALSEGIFLPVSDAFREEHVAAGLSPNTVFALYSAVEIPAKAAPLPEDETFRMLYAGRLCEEKGVHVAIKAMGILREDPAARPFVLDIAGTGDDEYVSRLKNEAERLGLGESVRFLGHVSMERMLELRSGSHLAVFPSIWAEPLGSTQLESMAMGLTIVGSPVGGAAEVLENEVNALTFPPGDHVALAQSVKRLMDDRELLVRLRKGARATAEERFDMRKLFKSHEYYLLKAAGAGDAVVSGIGGGIEQG